MKWSEEKELETIEGDILVAEEAVSEKETEMAKSDFYNDHAEDWKDHEEELKRRKALVSELYEKWERYTEIKATWEEWKANK